MSKPVFQGNDGNFVLGKELTEFPEKNFGSLDTDCQKRHLLIWIRRAYCLLDALNYATNLAKTLHEKQMLGECVCSSKDVRRLKKRLLHIMSSVRSLAIIDTSSLARKCPTLVLEHLSQALSWTTKASLAEESGIPARWKRFLYLPLAYGWAFLFMFTLWIYPAAVTTALKVGLKPKVLHCSCASQFNSTAVFGHVSAAKSLFLTSTFMSWMSMESISSTTFGPKERMWTPSITGSEFFFPFTSLHKCVFKEEIGDQVLKNHPDLDTRDVLGNTPLHLAILFEDVEAARLLVSSMDQVDTPDTQGNTALHTAVLGGNEELVELLRANGADLSVRCLAGCSPLKVALCLENSSVIRALVKRRPEDS